MFDVCVIAFSLILFSFLSMIFFIVSDAWSFVIEMCIRDRCKVAMDIVAKHVPADRDGVRIAELDERRFRHELWSYRCV